MSFACWSNRLNANSVGFKDGAFARVSILSLSMSHKRVILQPHAPDDSLNCNLRTSESGLTCSDGSAGRPCNKPPFRVVTTFQKSLVLQKVPLSFADELVQLVLFARAVDRVVIIIQNEVVPKVLFPTAFQRRSNEFGSKYPAQNSC